MEEGAAITMMEAFELDATRECEKKWPTVVKLLRQKFAKDGIISFKDVADYVPSDSVSIFSLFIRALRKEAM